MKVIGMAFVIIFVLAILLSLAFGLEWLGIKWYGFFGPKREAVRREVFKSTRSYNEGKEQELLKLRLEYMRADTTEEKEAIASTIRHSFADYDESLLTPELRVFLKRIKYPQPTSRRWE